MKSLKPITLAIVGSQELDNAQAYNARWLIRMVLEYYRTYFSQLKIISGGCRGVDTIAVEEADELEIEWAEFRPQVQQWDDRMHANGTLLRGFKYRNLQIIESCDRLVAIRSITSRTYGSGWTADEAERQGRLVRRFYV